MKVNKTQALLLIFKTLLEQGCIVKENIMDQIEITDLSFRRYMQELRAFLYNFNIPYELKYSKSDEKYYLARAE